MQPGFVDLCKAVPGIECDAKYAGHDNFLGEPADGYFANRVVAAQQLAQAVFKAFEFASEAGYGMLAWDSYRPQRAVDHFMRWALKPEDGATKARHYPLLERTRLVPMGYIAKKSGHTRGCAIDLTLTLNGCPIDMGGGFDLMDERSHHGYPGLDDMQRNNRELLKSFMERAGFNAYSKEWWHYSLKVEPYPDRYFDFAIE